MAVALVADFLALLIVGDKLGGAADWRDAAVSLQPGTGSARQLRVGSGNPILAAAAR